MNFTRGPREALQLIEGFEPAQIEDPAAAAQLLALRPMLLGRTDHVDEAHRLGQVRQPLIRREFGYWYRPWDVRLTLFGKNLTDERYRVAVRSPFLG